MRNRHWNAKIIQQSETVPLRGQEGGARQADQRPSERIKTIQSKEQRAKTTARLTGDPRSQEDCRAVFGAFSKWSVRTVEDEIKNRTDAKNRPVRLGGAPYGTLLNQTPQVLWVQNPKAGSSSLKDVLRQNKFNLDLVHADAKAFFVARDPLDRFLSGYGTIRARAGRLKPFDEKGASEVDLFRKFVDLQTSLGELSFKLPGQFPYTYHHAFSQMAFLEAYPREVQYILRLETINEDLAELKRNINLPCCEKGLPRRNRNEGGRFQKINQTELRQLAPDAVAKIVHYLRQDYICFGYPLPAI